MLISLRILLLLCTGIIVSFIPVQKELSGSHIIIDIQPFSDISKTEVAYVFAELKKVYPYVVLKPATALPRSAYYPPRNRYRADSLINFLGRATQAGHVTIGITSKDISTSKGIYTDWGVMGLGFCPGNACVASSFRLTRSQKLMQLFKSGHS